LLGANRELDSSITIERIVFHLVEEPIAATRDGLACETRATDQPRERERERATKQVSKQREASGASPSPAPIHLAIAS